MAHTIEFDNLAELRLPHHTSDEARGEGSDTPWLVSYVCWANVLEYVGPDGLTVGALRAQARTDRLLLEGLRRWRYLRLIPPAGKALTKPFPAATQVRTTRHGRRAQDIWRALPAVMDERWRGRFGDDSVERLHQALATVFTRLPIDPPAFLPVVVPHPEREGRGARRPDHPAIRWPRARPTSSRCSPGCCCPSRIDFEAESRLSLPISANTLRVLDRDPRRLRDLPRLTGVSKEGNAMCTGFLERRACAVVEPDPAATRGKVIRLTDKGVAARAKYERLAGRHRGGLAHHLRPASRRHAARRARDARRRRHPRVVSPGRRPDPRTRQLAGLGESARHAAPLPHGAAPWGLPRRQPDRTARTPGTAPALGSPDRSANRMWQAGSDAPLSPRRRPAPPGRRVVRRAGHRGRRHRGRRRARCGEPGAAHGPGREGRLRLGHLVEVLQDGPRRASATSSRASSGSSTRTWPSASACSTTRRTWSRPSRS